MRSVVMLVLDRYKEYGTIFLKAMKYYGEYERQLRLDRNGKFRQKTKAIEQTKDDDRFPNKGIIFTLFPELDEQYY
ncbi:hypothetical protein D3C79_1014490 [compost metagenome]